MMTGLFEKIAELLLNVPPFIMVFPDEGGVFLRLGKYKKTIGCGFHWKWPIFDRIEKIPVKMQEVNLVNQRIMRRDGKCLGVSGIIRYEVKDAQKAILEVQDYDTAMCNLALRTIANYVSLIATEECTPAKIEEVVLNDLQGEAEGWGIDVLDFGLSDFVTMKVIGLMGDPPNIKD